MDILRLIIVCPVFNDWESFSKLVNNIDNTLSAKNIDISILAVNDASTEKILIDKGEFLKDLNVVNAIEVLHLNCNLGHQRAIAVGLADLVARKSFDVVVVMDSDGEDRPEDLPALLDEYNRGSDRIIVARRDKRSEGNIFKIGYCIYKLLFRIMTGKQISFGNFCLIPSAILKSLVYMDNLWIHLPATILRSRFPIVMVSTKRGKRYVGDPKMNMHSLALLGLSAFSVYSDVVLLRTLFALLSMSIFTVVGIGIVTLICFFTDLVIPGWTLGVVGLLAVILVQFFVISIFVLFIILANRSQRTFIPAKHYSDFVLKLDVIFQR